MKTKLWKPILALAVVGVLLCALLTGCSGNSGDAETPTAGGIVENATAEKGYDDDDGGTYEDETYENGEEDAVQTTEDVALAAEEGAPGLTVPKDDRKIVLNANLTLESETFDETCKQIKSAAQKAGGYISTANIYSPGYDFDVRSASFTIRVPAEKYSGFLGEVDAAGTVVDRSEFSEDITREYVDTEARLKALRTQETRLLELMEQAGSLKDLLTVQEQLTEVQYQIEDYTATKNTYDNLVSYSTVEVNVQEVTKATEIPENTFSARMSAAFKGSWENFANFFREFSIGFVWALPALIVIAVIVVVVVLILRRVLKKQKAHATAGSALETEPISKVELAPKANAVQTPSSSGPAPQPPEPPQTTAAPPSANELDESKKED